MNSEIAPMGLDKLGLIDTMGSMNGKRPIDTLIEDVEQLRQSKKLPKPSAQLLVVRLNTASNRNLPPIGPIDVFDENQIRPKVQEQLDTVLKGVSGYVLVKLNKRKYKNCFYWAQRSEIDPEAPYIRFDWDYAPKDIAKLFTI